MKHFNTKIGFALAILIIGIFTVALANDGVGTGTGHMMGPGTMGYGMGHYGHMMDTCIGNGDHMMGYGTGGYANLSAEDAASLKQIREEFFKKTEELREKIEQKQLALNQELRKTEPDRDKAFDLQKELSELKSDFDQKALEHQLTLKKTFPDTKLSLGYGNGWGYCW